MGFETSSECGDLRLAAIIQVGVFGSEVTPPEIGIFRLFGDVRGQPRNPLVTCSGWPGLPEGGEVRIEVGGNELAIVFADMPIGGGAAEILYDRSLVGWIKDAKPFSGRDAVQAFELIRRPLIFSAAPNQQNAVGVGGTGNVVSIGKFKFEFGVPFKPNLTCEDEFVMLKGVVDKRNARLGSTRHDCSRRA